jgi:hypothetical protein
MLKVIYRILKFKHLINKILFKIIIVNDPI